MANPTGRAKVRRAFGCTTLTNPDELDRLRMGGWIKESPDGCILWTGVRNNAGYGLMPSGGGMAHRYVYEATVGPLLTKCFVHHKCENKRCVNPDHLELMTAAEHNAHHLALGVSAPRRGRSTGHPGEHTQG